MQNRIEKYPLQIFILGINALGCPYKRIAHIRGVSFEELMLYIKPNVYHIKFTQNPLYFIKKEGGKYSLNRMFDFDVERNGETAWTAGQEGSISIVRHTMRKNNILFTRRAYEQTGELFNQKPVAAGKGQAMLKRSDPRMSIQKYGGTIKFREPTLL